MRGKVDLAHITFQSWPASVEIASIAVVFFFWHEFQIRQNKLTYYFPCCRLTITASCPMNLQYFPMDRQLCHIEIESCKFVIDLYYFYIMNNLRMIIYCIKFMNSKRINRYLCSCFYETAKSVHHLENDSKLWLTGSR